MRRTSPRPFEKVLLHVGLPKTGTTSIQQSLLVNRNTLEAEGVLVPRFEEAGAEFGTTNASLFLNAVLGAPMSEKRKLVFERNLATFQRTINSRPHHAETLVLSGEAISMWSEKELRGFWEWGHAAQWWNEQTEFKLLYVARNFVEWFRKIAEQRVLNAPKVDDLMQLRVHMRHQVLTFKSSAEAVFGEECMAFGSFESWCASEGGLLQRFSEWLGASLPQRDFAANPSRSYEVLRLLRALGPEWPNRSIFANQLRHLPALKPAWRADEADDMVRFWQPVAEQWTALTGCEVLSNLSSTLDLSSPQLWSASFLDTLEACVAARRNWRMRRPELQRAFEQMVHEEGEHWAPETFERVQAFVRRLEENS